MVLIEQSDIIPSIVNSHPFPMATISGSATIPPMHEPIFRTTGKTLANDSSAWNFRVRTGTYSY